MRLSRPSLRLMYCPVPAIFSTKNWFLLTVYDPSLAGQTMGLYFRLQIKQLTF